MNPRMNGMNDEQLMMLLQSMFGGMMEKKVDESPIAPAFFTALNALKDLRNEAKKMEEELNKNAFAADNQMRELVGQGLDDEELEMRAERLQATLSMAREQAGQELKLKADRLNEEHSQTLNKLLSNASKLYNNRLFARRIIPVVEQEAAVEARVSLKK